MAFPSPSQRKILEERYFCKALNETTWADVCRRVAGAVASVEPETPDLRRERAREEFERVLLAREFLPNTPTLFNAGVPGGGSMMACNVRNPEDSMESILDAFVWAGLVSKYGGGTGFGFSKLRAKGAPIKSTHGKACGPLAVAKGLAAVSQMITQGGKRPGANMGVLDAEHPDVAEFVECKARESRWLLETPKAVAERALAEGTMSADEAKEFVEHCRSAALFQLFNLSVSVDDRFMEAAAAYQDWKDEGGLDSPDGARWMRKLPCGKTVAELWDLIVARAASSGDPGLIFLDRVQEYSRLQTPLEVISTNPCVAAGTLVATPKGWRPVEEIKEGDEIRTVLGTGRVKTVEVHKDEPVVRVTFSDGHSQVVTPAHQYLARRCDNTSFAPIRVDRLFPGASVRVSPSFIDGEEVDGPAENQRDLGFMIGVALTACPGGNLPPRYSRDLERPTEAAEAAWHKVAGNVFERNGFPRKSHDTAVQNRTLGEAVEEFAESIGMSLLCSDEPLRKEWINGNWEFASGLIDGLWSSAGNVGIGHLGAFAEFVPRSETIAKQLRLVLLNWGVRGNLEEIGNSTTELHKVGEDGKVDHELRIRITGIHLKRFVEKVKLTHSYLKANAREIERLEFRRSNDDWSAEIVSIEDAGVADVYDLFEPESDTWITEGYVQRGCGEQPIPSNGSCNLGSIDLSKFVLDPFEEDARFDAVRFEKVVATAVRFLDDVIDLNNNPMPEIAEVSRRERRLGLGVMGWADLLLKLGVRYDSDEAIKLADRIGRIFSAAAHQASYALADERGPFPLWKQVEGRKWEPGLHGTANPPNLFDPKRPRRNAAVTTVAPTGTLSRIAGCSGGIEPHFRAGFVDMALRDSGGLGFVWASETIEGFLSGTKETNPGETDVAAGAERLLAERFGWRGANEIPVYWHVAHQAAWQRWIDASISKTVNLDASATEADVADAFVRAFRSGCKGITVYRDGSKDMQPLNAVAKKEEPAPPAPAPKKAEAPRPERRRRPEVVDAKTYRIETAEGKMYVTIGHDERKMPFEIFCRLGKAGTTRNADLDAVSKLVSDMFRMNVHPARIVRTLRGIRSMPFGLGEDRVESVPDAIAQVVDRYMTETFGPGWGAAFGWRINDAVPEEEGAAPAPDPRQAALPLEVPARREFVACPDCGAEVVAETGCVRCSVCSWSRC